MVKRTIIIHEGNKDAVFSYFARTLTFNQYDKLPPLVKEEYLTWSMETFLKERQLLLKQRELDERVKELRQLESSKLEIVSKKWFHKAKFSLFKKNQV